MRDCCKASTVELPSASIGHADQEDASSGQIFRQLAEEDSKHAKQLLEQLRQKLNSGSR